MLPKEISTIPGLKDHLLSIKALPFTTATKQLEDYQFVLMGIDESLETLQNQNPYLARFCRFIISYTKEKPSAFTYYEADWLLNRTLLPLAEPLGLDSQEQESLKNISASFNHLTRLRPLDLTEEEKTDLFQK